MLVHSGYWFDFNTIFASHGPTELSAYYFRLFLPCLRLHFLHCLRVEPLLTSKLFLQQLTMVVWEHKSDSQRRYCWSLQLTPFFSKTASVLLAHCCHTIDVKHLMRRISSWLEPRTKDNIKAVSNYFLITPLYMPQPTAVAQNITIKTVYT